ncbi:hypothetical protein TNCV_867131 [Trichonephila clavipes]|nr:hypothetical protein TNCV_867131 [Trichonephila clavipes]
MKIDEIDERIIFDTLDQEVGISSSTVNSEQKCKRSLESLGVKRRILLKLINTHPVETDTLGTRFGIQSFSKDEGV